MADSYWGDLASCGKTHLSRRAPRIVARNRRWFKLSSNDGSNRVSDKQELIEKALDNP